MADYKFSGVVDRKIHSDYNVCLRIHWEVTRQELFNNDKYVRTYFKVGLGLIDETYQHTIIDGKDLKIRLTTNGYNLTMIDGGNDYIVNLPGETMFDLSQGEVIIASDREFYIETHGVNVTPESYVKPISGTFSFGGRNIGLSTILTTAMTPSKPATIPELISAPDFNDEENPTITYPAVIPEGVSVEACISFTGGTDDVPYRSIPLVGGSYTFNLTSAERKTLRQGITTGNIKALRFYIKSTFRGTTTWHYLTKNLTLINHTPTLNPTVKDIKLETIALTGNENIVIRYESMVEYSTGATARKEAGLVSQSIQCGSKTITNLPQGVIDDVESGVFVFRAADSRGFSVESTLQKNIINYVKPTCYQDLKAELSGETGARIVVTINGNYYNGSFGAVNNTFKFEMRYKTGNGSYGAWTTINTTPIYNGTTYETSTTITGLSYSEAYTVQCRVTDKLNVVESSSYTIKLLPVFDWSEEDFNFNVPVKINGETIIRHNKDAKNTVLSASGGHIYIRPGGTDNTSGELTIKPDGSVTFGNTINVNNTATFSGNVNLNGYVNVNGVPLEDLFPEQDTYIPADFVVETGTEAMGTNGTWYWTKWNSGKAECYGRRNFGKVAMTTSLSNGYRSPEFTQDLPSGLFNAAPDVISMTACPNGASNYSYCWVVPSVSTASSATSTGSFYLMRSNTGTAAASDISFNIIGRWQ